ncbi:DUF177 domain-containing protein [Lactobacillus sp. S2-2]|uniref:DUF177 domain-containing protein n=1 Tax=Lactobacillus sp. S2-2 TaxID=2692917 RepID=UPI001F41DD9D|nr:DUF177 domain-containing protein [Lactobacillus sp. S2-2]MCF6515138.1 DUF177 domain-containing protein [Lactobacillus sp. S2-2]
MKWSFEYLQDYKNHPLEEEQTLNLRDSLMKRYPEDILDASPINVSVQVINDQGDMIVDAKVEGKIVVPSSRSLEPVELPLNFSFTEIYVDAESKLDRYEKTVVVLLVDEKEKIIDFDKAVEDNIIVQIPMHVLSPEESENNIMPEGNDWKVISKEDIDESEKDSKNVDPRLAKLKDFYND